MNITKLEQARRRKAISGIIASMIMFAMIFTVAIGYFLFVNEGAFQSLQADQVRQQALQQASVEKLSIQVGLSTVPDLWGQTGDLWLRITNVGGAPSTLIDVFVINTDVDRIASNSQVVPGTQYLSTKGTGAQRGDLNYSLPLTIQPGVSTALMTACGAAAGCDIAISKTSYTYGGSPVVVSVLTSSGNIFSAQYPTPPGGYTVTATQVVTISSVSILPGGNPGGNILVVQMVATPPQTFICAHCVNDTVTVYNYGTSPVTGITLFPAVPLVSITGNFTLSSTSPCNLIGGNNTLPAYSGSGAPPKIVYVCTFSANPKGLGGYASFTGTAKGTFNGSPVTSGEAISNSIQIGGPANVLNQGPFSANFFFFKYSACTNAPSGGRYSPKCTTTPNPVTYANLPTASLITGSSSYYIAFYVTIYNNFNVTLPILPYTYFLTDPTKGGESPFYVVGDPAGVLPYIPNYDPGGNGIPRLTPYPSTCIATSTASCINLAPGGSVTLTFAACDIGSAWWDWAGRSYGSNFDSGNTCTTNPPAYQPNESTYLSILITFAYKGQVYTQQIPFVGQTVR